MERLSEVKTELLHNLQKQISQSSKKLTAQSLHHSKRNNGREQEKNNNHGPLNSDSMRKRVRQPTKSHKKPQKVKAPQTSARWQIQNDMAPLPQQLISGRITKPKRRFDL
jgi:3-oxoacyl-ACP reductase-like protein